jgi:hypothetical protein
MGTYVLHEHLFACQAGNYPFMPQVDSAAHGKQASLETSFGCPFEGEAF